MATGGQIATWITLILAGLLTAPVLYWALKKKWKQIKKRADEEMAKDELMMQDIEIGADGQPRPAVKGVPQEGDAQKEGKFILAPVNPQELDPEFVKNLRAQHLRDEGLSPEDEFLVEPSLSFEEPTEEQGVTSPPVALQTIKSEDIYAT